MTDDFEKMYCGAIRRGDVLEGEIGEGKRSLLVVLQDDVLNQSLPTVLCALIERSEKTGGALVDEVILKSKETGSKEDGVCLLHKIYTVRRDRIYSKKGELSKEKLNEVYKALDVTLGKFRDELMDDIS